MSKELIERLRVFAGDPVLGSVADEAADRIEELERELNLIKEDYGRACQTVALLGPYPDLDTAMLTYKLVHEYEVARLLEQSEKE